MFDTTTVVSALIFPNGRLSWLRRHWADGGCLPLLSAATASELTRVLRYPKFRLSEQDVLELLAEYLPFCEIVDQITGFSLTCRDVKDQPFLDLAHSGKAELLVSGDRDLLAPSEQTDFVIETPEAYRVRIEKHLE